MLVGTSTRFGIVDEELWTREQRGAKQVQQALFVEHDPDNAIVRISFDWLHGYLMHLAHRHEEDVNALQRSLLPLTVLDIRLERLRH